MSDFLNNLIARQSEAAPQVLPRHTTLFEAETSTPQPEQLEEFGNETPEPTHFYQTVAKNGPQTATAPFVQQSDVLEPVALTQNTRLAAPQHDQSEPVAAISQPVVRLNQPEPMMPLRQTEHEPEVPPVLVPRAKRARPPVLVPEPPATRQQDTSQVSFRVQETQQIVPQASASTQTQVVQETQQIVPQASAKTQIQSIAEQQAPTALPQIQPFIPPDLPNIVPQAAPVQQQINITIGRIEVRAAATNPPARRQQASARQSHVLTLEEYLSRRRGGR